VDVFILWTPNAQLSGAVFRVRSNCLVLKCTPVVLLSERHLPVHWQERMFAGYFGRSPTPASLRSFPPLGLGGAMAERGERWVGQSV